VSARVVPAVGPQLLGAEFADRVEVVLSRCAHATNLIDQARRAHVDVPAELEEQIAVIRDELLARMGLTFAPPEAA
jgi:hypothetical protein